MRSRFHVALLLGGLLLLTGCSRHFGPGITELAAARGWQPLPIGSWLLNDGIDARAMAFCPRESCTRQAFAALIAVEGREAEQLEKALGADPARLARAFAKPASQAKTGAKSAPAASVKSTTTVARFAAEGAKGILVEIQARDTTGKLAATAILYGRDSGRLLVALAVSNDAETARRDASATWRSR